MRRAVALVLPADADPDRARLSVLGAPTPVSPAQPQPDGGSGGAVVSTVTRTREFSPSLRSVSLKVIKPKDLEKLGFSLAAHPPKNKKRNPADRTPLLREVSG